MEIANKILFSVNLEEAASKNRLYQYASQLLRSRTLALPNQVDTAAAPATTVLVAPEAALGEILARAERLKKELEAVTKELDAAVTKAQTTASVVPMSSAPMLSFAQRRALQ